MITFITALYPEAKELIHILNLRKCPEETLYQLFAGEHARLIITGAGMISAATVTARHFAKYPASNQDIVINLGVAGYAPGTTGTACLGDLFLVSHITEQVTKRTFYPDLLYKNSFRLLPLTTVPVVCTNYSTFVDETLIDMEASALYQALLPHISTDRMLFFKVISDLPGTSATNSAETAALLSPHLTTILSFVTELQAYFNRNVPCKPVLTPEEQTLSDEIKKRLPLTEAMSRDYTRLLSYAKLADKPLAALLQTFLDEIKDSVIRGKKQAMPYLSRLREHIISGEELSTSVETAIQTNLFPKVSRKETPYLPFFSTVYIEKDIPAKDWPETLSSAPIVINHYKDIFNRSHQDFAAQKKAPSLILAKKTGTLIYQGAPVCQSFGNEHFYYTSCMMNCIYHCDYCYLQGMYPSGHVVVFVNLEDYFDELETLLKQHPVYLCISYDTDLLALEQTFSFVSRWLSFAKEHPDLTLEIRTKSGNAAVFRSLAEIYQDKEYLKHNIIFAWTVSPDILCRTIEQGAASLPLRLKALHAAKQAGFSVRLCFDPMIIHGNWKKHYSTLVDNVFSTITATDLYDVSVGVFRISTEYLKTMRSKRPDSAIVQYPYITENGVSHYGALSEEMVQYMKTLLLSYLPEEKIFVWNGGEA